MKKKLLASLVLLGILAMPTASFADAAVGDQIVTIGTNLNQQQRQEVLNYFGANDNAQIIDVDISEERQYLSGKIPDAQIGNSTNSCAMITYTKSGSGVNVTTHNINYVTPEAYKSAIITAGINDADVKITAPMEVSGTGALTGIMKAYEVSTGDTIGEDVKQAATQELVTNTELGQQIGDDKANDLINTIKTEIADKKPQNEQEVQSLVDQVLSELGITLTDEQYQQLLNLVNQLANLDIDWGSVADNVSGLIHSASDYLSTDEGQGFLNKLQAIVNSFFDWVRGLFGGGDSDAATNDQPTDATTNDQSTADTQDNSTVNDQSTDATTDNSTTTTTDNTTSDQSGSYDNGAVAGGTTASDGSTTDSSTVTDNSGADASGQTEPAASSGNTENTAGIAA